MAHRHKQDRDSLWFPGPPVAFSSTGTDPALQAGLGRTAGVYGPAALTLPEAASLNDVLEKTEAINKGLTI